MLWKTHFCCWITKFVISEDYLVGIQRKKGWSTTTCCYNPRCMENKNNRIFIASWTSQSFLRGLILKLCKTINAIFMKNQRQKQHETLIAKIFKFIVGILNQKKIIKTFTLHFYPRNAKGCLCKERYILVYWFVLNSDFLAKAFVMLYFNHTSVK